MSSIDNLTTITTLAGGDYVAGHQIAGGFDAKFTLSTLLTFIQNNFTNPAFVEDARIPVTGQNVIIADNSKNARLILTPAGTLATLTITLPLNTNAADGQEVLVTSTQIITALTIAGNGATAVNGAPTTMAAANGFFKLRFSKPQDSWYLVSN